MNGIKTYDLGNGLELIEAPESLDMLATLIKSAVDDTMRAATNAVEGALIVGKMLIDAKAQVKHGEWDNWITQNCNLAPRTARGYMRLANTVPQLDDSKRQRVADLPLREAFKAIATDPTEPPKQKHINIREAKRTDRERTADVFGKAERAMKDCKKLIADSLTVKGQQVSDLRKKLNAVLAELERMEADSVGGAQP